MARYVQTQLAGGVAPDGTRVVSAENLAATWAPRVAIPAEPGGPPVLNAMLSRLRPGLVRRRVPGAAAAQPRRHRLRLHVRDRLPAGGGPRPRRADERGAGGDGLLLHPGRPVPPPGAAVRPAAGDRPVAAGAPRRTSPPRPPRSWPSWGRSTPPPSRRTWGATRTRRWARSPWRCGAGGCSSTRASSGSSCGRWRGRRPPSCSTTARGSRPTDTVTFRAGADGRPTMVLALSAAGEGLTYTFEPVAPAATPTP